MAHEHDLLQLHRVQEGKQPFGVGIDAVSAWGV
jgi:hypothetical protein